MRLFKPFFIVFCCYSVFSVCFLTNPTDTCSQSLPSSHSERIRAAMMNSEISADMFFADSTFLPYESFAPDQYPLQKPTHTMGVEESWMMKFDSYTIERDINLIDHATDSRGNIYITGMLYDPGSKMDIALIKYDSLGTEQWIRFYNGTANADDIAEGVTVDQDDNIYVYGASNDLTTGLNGLLLQYSGDGEMNWDYKHVLPLNIGRITTVNALNDGKVYFATSSSAALNTLNGIFLSRISREGVMNWQHQVKKYSSYVFCDPHLSLDATTNKVIVGLADSEQNQFEVYCYDSVGNNIWTSKFEAENWVSTFYHAFRDIKISTSEDVIGVAEYEYFGNNSFSTELIIVRISPEGKIVYKKSFIDEKPIKVDWLSSGYVKIFSFSWDHLIIRELDAAGELHFKKDFALPEISYHSSPFQDVSADTSGNQYFLIDIYHRSEYSHITVLKLSPQNEMEIILGPENFYPDTYSVASAYSSVSNCLYITGRNLPFLTVFNTDGSNKWKKKSLKATSYPLSSIRDLQRTNNDEFIVAVTEGGWKNPVRKLLRFDSDGTKIQEQVLKKSAGTFTLDNDGNWIILNSVEIDRNRESLLMKKFDSGFNPIWETFIPGRPDSTGRIWLSPREINIDRHNNIYFSAASIHDGHIMSGKVSSDGKIIWTADSKERWSENTDPRKRFRDYFSSAEVDINGNYYLCGITFLDDITFFLLKYDSRGKLLWYKHFGNGWPRTSNLHIDKSGNILVTGVSQKDCDNSIELRKYTSGGKLLYEQIYDPPGGSAWGYDLSTNSHGDIIIAGFSNPNEGGFDCLTLVFDTNGNLLDELVYDTGGNEVGETIQIDQDDSFYVFGNRKSSVYGEDAFVLKYDKENNQVLNIHHTTEGYGHDSFSGGVVDSYGGIILNVNVRGASGSSHESYLVKYQQTGDDLPVHYIPEKVLLQQNFPNPFQHTTRITYELPAPSPVEFKVFDILGRKVLSYDFANQPAGEHNIYIDGLYLTSGIYYYQMHTKYDTQTKKMVLVR